MSQINEFQPNPPGQDPDMQMFELFGTPNATFDGWIITIESDDGNSQLGLVDSANLVSGTFDADGLLTVEIPGFENPGFTIALLDGTNGFTGTAGVTDLDTDNDGVADDVSTLGTVLDAIGVPDSTADEATLYGVQLGGTDFSFTGAEPELIFRESTLGDLYAVNLLDVNGGGDVFDTSGVAVLPGTFATDPSTGTTFGAANPGIGTTAPANFTLELLHFTDQEANASTIDNIDNLSAVLTALRDQDLGDDGVADNTLTLSSGDVIIPGLFFDASEVVFGAAGIADIQIQNELGLQASALGNHEFDLGTAFLADLISGTTAVTNDNGTPDDPSDDFVEEVPLGNFDALTGTALDGLDFTGAAFPYLSANLGFDTDPNLAPLEVAGGQAPLGNVVTSSTVIEEGGEQIGVVGATVPTIDSISSAGSDIGIFPEDFDSNPTDAQLDALAAILQAEVDALLAANPNLNKVIVLSHMQQISIEEGLAERLDGVDIIVAGGSNTRLFDDNDRIRDGDSDQGQYPTFITNPGGTFTAVMNTDAQYKYVGRLVIDFDANGNILPASYDETVSGAYATDDLGVVELGFETFDPFEMSEDQEVGTTPPDTAATGSVTLDAINGTTGEVTISGTFSGLTDANESNALFPVGGVDSAGNPESAIHLHNAAAGENGPIVRNFTVTDNGDGSGSFTGTFTLTAGEMASLVAGETYVNLHTTDFNGGQLRGQVDIPEAVEMSGLIDPEVDAITDAIQAQIVATESNVFGVSDVFLNGNRFGDMADPTDPDGVRTQETNLGNLTADANLVYANQMIEANDLGDPVVVSIKNGGGIRANIGEIVVPGGGTEAVRQPNSSVVDENGVVVKPEGGISQNDIASTLAFNNGLALLDITKAELVAVLEEGVGALPNISGGFPQVSGVKFSFDPDLPTGERIVSAGIFDENDELVAELVSNGEIVGDQTEVFRIVTLDFLADGGDPILSALSSPNRVDLEDIDADGIDDGASTGAATFSIDGTEQDALAEYLNDNFNPDNGGTAFNEADTGRDTDGRIQNLAFREDDVLPAPTNPEAPVATGDVEVAIYAEFDSGVGADGAEVVAHEDGVLYVTNGETGAIDVFEIPETAAPGTAAAPTSSIDLTGLPGFDGVQSVAVKNGLIAVAISRATEAATIFGTEVELSQNGFVALFDTETLTLQARLDVGVLPDQLTFSADGSQLYVAGEGEKNDDSDNDDNPLGTVALIDLDLQGDLADSTVNLVDFTQFNGFEELAREAGIRVQEGVSIAEDLEPEYVAVSPDGETIFVSLQENNAIAKIDVATGEVEEIFSLGLQDHSLPGNEIDPLDNGVPEIRNFDNLVSFRMADAIASFQIDGQTYVATANEGDSRGFDEDRVEDLAEDGLLDPDLEAQLRADGLLDDDGDTDVGLERLEVSTIDGDTDGDGDIDVIHSFSSRSFSIFDEDGNLVFDSGSEFEAIIAELAPERFNDDDGDEGEDRSDAKGPEPEAIAIGEVGGRDYAFIGLERDSGIMIYDVSDPANSFFVNYIPPLFVNDAGDGEIAKQGPEIITVIDAEESATGNTQIAVSYEISGTTIVYDLTPTSPLVEIYDIQGAGHISPLVGQTVSTQGVVTAVDFNGYYLQDPEGDGDDATSDGIFVFTGNGQAGDMNVGDLVEVSGTVSEFIPGGAGTGNLSSTQISEDSVKVVTAGFGVPDSTLIGANGRTPPTEVIISDSELPVNLQTDPGIFNPETDGIDFYESLEGMLVQIDNPVAISATNRFDETWVVSDDGAFVTSGSDTGGLNSRGALEINADPDGYGDLNPERIQIQYDAFFDLLPDGFTPPDITVGDDLSDVTGVVGYSFGNFEVLVTEEFTIETPSTIEAEVQDLSPNTEEEGLTVATYNVLNVTANTVGTDADEDEVEDDDDAAQIAIIAQQIVENLGSPDIIGLQEIQDDSGVTDDGTLDATDTLQALVDAIAAAGGPTYEFEQAELLSDGANGGAPGSNIRNAFLYNPDRVEPVGFETLLPEDLTALGADNPDAFFESRDPHVGTFTFGNDEVVVVNNHFSSRFGSEPIYGGPQPFNQGGEQAREDQANAVNLYVDTLLTDDPDAKVVVMGDLNTFEFTDEIAEDLQGVGDEQILTNLHDLNTEDDGYTFVFQGNAQNLDHILVTDSLLEGVEVDIVHVNTDFPAFASDHEPIVARLALSPIADELIAGGPGNDTLEGGAGDDTILGRGGDDELSGNEGNDSIVGGRGDDEISGNDGDDSLFGGRSDDDVFGNDGDDVIFGGRGDDDLAGNDGDDSIFGGRGDDDVLGNAGNDSLFGRRGDDDMSGNDGDDALFGGGGDDELSGNDGNDLVFGGSGGDDLSGNAGNDTLSGDRGDDVINGGAGEDLIEGGRGDDTMTGGADADTFVFRGRFDIDTINDFTTQAQASGDADILRFVAGSGEAGSVQEFLDATTQLGNNLVYDLGDDNRNVITLVDVDRDDLGDMNFEFI